MLIDRYLLRLIAVPFAATLGIFLCLLLIIRLVDLVNYVVAEGGSVGALLQLVIFLVPQYLALALPVGLLAGVTLAFRRLAQGGEWDALLAGGVSTQRLLRAPCLFAVAVAAGVLLVAGFAQPLSLYGYEKLRFELGQGRGGISVAAGEFKRIGQGLVVRARESRDGGKDLRGVFISMRDDRGSIVLAAERGYLARGKITLLEGRLIRIGAQREAASFETYEIPFAMPEPPPFRPRGNHERELTLAELVRFDDEIGDAAARAGLARRGAQAAAVLLVPFLGIAVARPPRRKKGAEGLFIGLAVFLVYNELSLFGERLGFSGQAPPVALQLLFLALFAAAALGLFARAAGGPRWMRFKRSARAPA